ncbi:MAG: TIGR00730 family Rossman fold protein [Xanthomonadales bacterium]|nr:TIGR00730 family Rossman fold protein [Xanthomonadales bacterium]
MIKQRNNPGAPIRRVTVYAASSGALANHYVEAAAEAGRVIARAGLEIVYGGGNTGLMGAMANAALGAGGQVHGVVPTFLKELEVTHEGLSSLEVVEDMRQRKHLMLYRSDAVITLPGGCGTYEEVFEALTLKRLGQWLGPVVFLNTRGFYSGLDEFMRHAIRERFMGEAHGSMWSMVNEPAALVDALSEAPAWGAEALNSATVRATG